MKEQLISFKTSKLAKEKGFYELGISEWYDENKELKEAYYNGIQDYETYNHFDKLEYPCMTQSLLQKWLREKFNAHITINSFAGSRFTCSTMIDNCQEFIYTEDPIAVKYFNTYEEALEEGLQKVLNLIN